MKKRLIEFLPSQIGDIEDFKQIMNIEDIELNNIENKQLELLNENFIDTATQYGIKHQEKLFKIRSDLGNETLEFRKLRIKNRKIDKSPFTYRFLEHKLETLFGKENYKLELLNNKYILKVDINTFDWNMFNEIVDNFRTIIPCNIILKSALTQKINFKVYIGACTTTGEEVIVYPWMPKDITSTGKVNIAMGSNTGKESMIVFPKQRRS